ncbi:MAG: hypothetical protein CSA49_04710 [Gammaproteobacteria bacterium]|nr:MAG: hypothetical protein CSA49_04710 [Gammaproteobacteria bacterium]
MKTYFKALFVWAAFTSVASASGLSGLDLSRTGPYSVVNGNIVKINGKTMIKTAETKLISCEGKRVKQFYKGTLVDVKLVEPVKGPTPVLKEIRAVCN